MRMQTVGNLEEAIFDNEVVPSSIMEIAPIIRVANEVKKTHPRVTYLCKFILFLRYASCESGVLIIFGFVGIIVVCGTVLVVNFLC